jgi:hypothetical protein
MRAIKNFLYVHFVTKVSLHVWNQRLTTDLLCPNLNKKNSLTLFRGFRKLWPGLMPHTLI